MAIRDTISDSDTPDSNISSHGIEGNDFSSAESPSSGFSFTSPPMLIAVVSGLLGLIGLIIATMAFLKISSITADLTEIGDKIKTESSTRLFAIQSLQEELDGYDQRLENIGSELVKMKRSQLDTKQIQRLVDTINNLARDVKINRDEINDNRLDVINVQGLVEDLAESREKPGVVVQKPAGSILSDSSDSSHLSTPEDGYHLIQSGDTYDRLAKLYGVTIEALMQANPGVNPRRLQIGQKIAIPGL